VAMEKRNTSKATSGNAIQNFNQGRHFMMEQQITNKDVPTMNFSVLLEEGSK